MYILYHIAIQMSQTAMKITDKILFSLVTIPSPFLNYLPLYLHPLFITYLLLLPVYPTQGILVLHTYILLHIHAPIKCTYKYYC